MKKIILMTDSACDIPAELEEQYGIQILPFLIAIDGKSYEERVDFTNEEYYKLLTKCENIPSTAQITMMRFLEIYEAHDQEGVTDLIYVGINAAGSGTFNAATLAQDTFAQEHPESKMRIHLVDSHTYSMAYGYFICEAARKLQNGASVCDLIHYLNDSFAQVEIALSMYTLKFVKKSGRVSAAAAFAGELLGLRPVITIVDGESATVGKVRGDANVIPALVAHMKKKTTGKQPYLVGCTSMENGKMLANLCKKEMGYAPEHVFLLGCAVSTNTGPDTVALVFMGENRR